MKKTVLPLCMSLAALLAAAQPATAQTILYSDDFSGASTTNLFGQAPDVDNISGTATWTNAFGAGSTPFNADGSIDTPTANLNTGVYLPFTPQQGNEYVLTGTLNTVNPSGEGPHWLGFGFLDTDSLIQNEGYGWVGIRGNRGSSGDGFIVPGKGVGGISNITPPTGVISIEITLDATDASAANWTMSFDINNGSITASNLTASSGSYADISYVGFGKEGQAGGTIGAFELQQVPEPASAGLLLGGLAALSLLRRRRR